MIVVSILDFFGEIELCMKDSSYFWVRFSSPYLFILDRFFRSLSLPLKCHTCKNMFFHVILVIGYTAFIGSNSKIEYPLQAPEVTNCPLQQQDENRAL